MATNLTFTQKYSYSIIIGVVFFIVAFLFFSCSARTSKTDKSKIDSTATAKIEVTEKSSTTVKEVIKLDSTSTKKKETIVNIFEDALELEPIDPKQESSFTDSNGKTKTFKNVRIKTNKTKDNSIINESENVRKIEEKEVEISTLKDIVSQLSSEVSVLKDEKSKSIVKPQFNWSTFILQLWWLWILILVALYLGYKYYKGVNPFNWVIKIFKR